MIDVVEYSNGNISGYVCTYVGTSYIAFLTIIFVLPTMENLRFTICLCEINITDLQSYFVLHSRVVILV